MAKPPISGSESFKEMGEQFNYEELFDNSPCGYIFFSEKKTIIQCNTTLLEWLGYEKEELVRQKTLPDLFGKGTQIYLETHFFPSLQFYGEIKEVNLDVIKKDGGVIPVLINSKLVSHAEGFSYFQASLFDISNRNSYEKEVLKSKKKSDEFVASLKSKNVLIEKQNEQILDKNAELVSLNQELKSKNRKLNDFAQIISHNLRGPVNNIRSLLDFHGKGKSEAEKENLMDLIHTVSDHLFETLNDLVEVLKTQHQTGLETERLSFTSVLSQQKQFLAGNILKEDALIISDFSEVDEIVYSRLYLESIFLNMISNSLKYRSRDRTPQINIQTALINGACVLTVEDNGLGIDMERYGKEVFGFAKTFHEHPDSKGVGLYMVKSQIESMGGEITVESKFGVGTTFRIQLLT